MVLLARAVGKGLCSTGRLAAAWAGPRGGEMRAVFVRRRAEKKATPVWMGGLNYQDHATPRLPWNIGKRTLSSNLASSSPQTRAHTGVSEGDGCGEREVVRSRPSTSSGRARLQSARPSSGQLPLSARQRRPHTAGAMGSQDSHRRGLHLGMETRSCAMPSQRPNTARSAARTYSSPTRGVRKFDDACFYDVHGRKHTADGKLAQDRKTPSLMLYDQNMPPVLLGPEALDVRLLREKLDQKGGNDQPHQFHLLRANIVGVGGSGFDGTHEGSDAAILNTVVSLAIDGTNDGAAQTKASQPFKFSTRTFVPLPEAWTEFELTGNVHRMLLRVQMARIHSGHEKKPKHGHQDKNQPADGEESGMVQLGSCLVDLGTVLKAGGSKVEVCKLTHSRMGKKSLEVHIDLRIEARKTDFDYEWADGMPMLKKAGYIVTAEGMLAPESFVVTKEQRRKATKQANFVLEDFLVIQTLQDTQPVRVFRACRTGEDGMSLRETYTVKRFPIMEADARRQLIAELDGMLELPEHIAVKMVDCFIDRLEAVLVLDNEGEGKYLSETVSKKGAMPERLVSIVTRQVLTALVFIHNERMRVHNNITADNLLVLRSGEVRVGGFGFSSPAFLGHTSCKFAGDWTHMAPERMIGLECGYKADVWSVGILTLGLIIGACPYDMSRFTQPSAIYEFKRAVIEEPSPCLKRGGDHTEDARLFVDSCLNKNLKLRAEVKGLLVQQFVTKYEGLTPNYLARWLNRSDRRRRMADPNIASGDSPLRQGDQAESPTTGALGGDNASPQRKSTVEAPPDLNPFGQTSRA